jgi:transcriptional regulator with PAS, ATPase and Fis domain
LFDDSTSTAKGDQADIGADLRANRETGITAAYREHEYRLQKIAAHLGIHYATVSRKLKKIERTN